MSLELYLIVVLLVQKLSNSKEKYNRGQYMLT